MKNIAIYYRVSTERQNFAMQEKSIKDWLVKQEPRPTYKTFKDFAQSGKKDTRPKFQECVRRCRKGEFDALVCYRIDRFSRSTSTAIRTILDLDAVGCSFVAVDQPVLNLSEDIPFKTAILAIFAELAQIERETIVARVKAGLAAAKARGVKLGRKPKVDTEMMTEIRRLRDEGKTVKQIGRAVKVSHVTVWRKLKEDESNNATRN